MRLPRWYHRLYAFFGGYFWIPCPICGRKFGGHEAQWTLWTTPWSGWGVCLACKAEADRRSAPVLAQRETERLV